ncbi:PAS domain-containing protein [Sphingomonas sp. ABOLE]|uniref:PAS domain-containing protein n=1 Tax=Sphingomonas sp. ABOLE TaxID=1985878 RepID=UPI000F7D8FB6|nr:PAS domain-containing protein [Sphingomonas sp. ABOLE]RSV39642.1 PAS domain-containing protein [Sphingomonas sp. ABOLE]
MTPQLPSALRDYFESSPVALSLGEAAGDHPLLLTNKRFRDLTGYASNEIAGKNCRFLQGNSDNREARTRIHAFLDDDAQTSVRTAILNFRKDGTPFVNLLYMSKLRALTGEVRYIFASQFDVSRTQPERLADYDNALGQTIARLAPVVAESGIAVEGTLITIANTAATIAQAKMTLSDLDTSSYL